LATASAQVCVPLGHSSLYLSLELAPKSAVMYCEHAMRRHSNECYPVATIKFTILHLNENNRFVAHYYCFPVRI